MPSFSSLSTHYSSLFTSHCWDEKDGMWPGPLVPSVLWAHSSVTRSLVPQSLRCAGRSEREGIEWGTIERRTDHVAQGIGIIILLLFPCQSVGLDRSRFHCLSSHLPRVTVSSSGVTVASGGTVMTRKGDHIINSLSPTERGRALRPNGALRFLHYTQPTKRIEILTFLYFRFPVGSSGVSEVSGSEPTGMIIEWNFMVTERNYHIIIVYRTHFTGWNLLCYYLIIFLFLLMVEVSFPS